MFVGGIVSPSMNTENCSSIDIDYYYRKNVWIIGYVYFQVKDNTSTWNTLKSYHGGGGSGSWVAENVSTLTDSKYFHDDFQIRFITDTNWAVMDGDDFGVDTITVDFEY